MLNEDFVFVYIDERDLILYYNLSIYLKKALLRLPLSKFPKKKKKERDLSLNRLQKDKAQTQNLYAATLTSYQSLKSVFSLENKHSCTRFSARILVICSLTSSVSLCEELMAPSENTRLHSLTPPLLDQNLFFLVKATQLLEQMYRI